MIAVIDSGILMNTNLIPQINSDIVIPRSVHEEIQSGQASHLLEMLPNKIDIIDPLPKYIIEVKETAQKMGQNKLSPQDIDLLATAIMMSEQDEIKIYSDDFAIRNIAHQLGYDSEGITTKGGEEKRTYGYKCKACGHVSDELVSDCDICGHEQFQRFRKS